MAKFKHFELDEFVRSATAEQCGLDNTPTFEVVDRLGTLVERVLDPLREAWGSAIRVSSGYRSRALNAAVGGSATSAHLSGWAADLQPADPGEIDEFIAFVAGWCKATGTAYDQIIDERSKSSGARWCHFGLYAQDGRQRGEFKAMTKND